jgi:hypothetical protein
MESNLLAATALLFGTLAIYTQLNIPRFATTRRTTVATRGLLAVTGCGLGLVSAALFPGDAGQAMLAFVSGFGVVHFPAAFILLLKHAQRSGRG